MEKDIGSILALYPIPGTKRIEERHTVINKRPRPVHREPSRDFLFCS